MPAKYDAVMFDLLSALLDSWSLWDDVAGDKALGRKWRMRYLEATCDSTGFEPYIPLIAGSAKAVGLDGSLAGVLVDRWEELRPWPEATSIIEKLSRTTRVGVVTNCSETLGLEAAARFNVEFDLVLTAERAGCYKPRPEIYLQAIEEIDVAPDRILYVAGSPFDVLGAASAGLPVYWHNRLEMKDAEVQDSSLASSGSLDALNELVF